jgi:Polyketide cyclase / dehydrase and lipid transport
MASIEQSLVVNVPVRTAYNQWTQFEEFPQFMEGVVSVRQLDDKRLHWRANIGGKIKEWVAEITEQRPDERIAWTSRGGAYNAGVVTFHRLDDNRTKPQTARRVFTRLSGSLARKRHTVFLTLAPPLSAIHVAEPNLDGLPAWVRVAEGRTVAVCSRPGHSLLTHARVVWLQGITRPMGTWVLDRNPG